MNEDKRAGGIASPRDEAPRTGTNPAYLDLKIQQTRVLLTGFYFSIGCLAYLAGAVDGHQARVLGAIGVMPISGLAALFFMMKSGRGAPLLTAGCLGLDTLLATWVIYWTGGATSPCLPFYLTTVMAAAFRFGLPGSISYTMVSVACYCVANLLLPSPGPAPHNTQSLILRIVILFAAAGVGVGALHRKMERFRKEKRLRMRMETANRNLEAAYRELKSAQDQLLHAEKLASLGRLVAGVAHEINNPVSFVYGNLIHLETYVRRMKSLLEFYDHVGLPEDTRRESQAMKQAIGYELLWEDFGNALGDARDGTERVRRIVDALRKFSRLRKGEFRKVDVCEVIENALSILAVKKKPDVQIVRDCATETPVCGDPDELNQLFLNLLSNAVDALENRGGTITVRARDPGEDSTAGKVLIEVEDDGPGIAPEHRDRIFEPFFTTKEVGKGTGLGLSIAYGIVGRHKGEIGLSNAPGGGARFQVSLPRWKCP